MNLVIPIAPKPQSRPRFSRNTKKAYEESSMTAYKKAVAYYVKSYAPIMIEKGAVIVTVRFYIYPPKYVSEVKKNRLALEKETIFVDKKPDIDNYFKATTDALNGILFKDDGQIAVMSCQKLYSFNPRTEIEVENL